MPQATTLSLQGKRICGWAGVAVRAELPTTRALQGSESEIENEVKEPVELHLFAPTQEDDLIELLFAVAHYHRTETPLWLGHSVNFGRPWWRDSLCAHGLISLPYLDGPPLEWLDLGSNKRVRFLWLIPVTADEIEFKKKAGLEALESAFEQKKIDYIIDYINPLRKSLV
jgi:hypothetical protein